jgi:2-methylcitrate dehydratase PrpD
MGFTHSIAQWILNIGYHDFSEDVKQSAKRCILDTIGVALAGSMTDVSNIIREYVLHESCVGKSLIWGTGVRTSPGLAALANGTMVHALDFDETNYSSIAHPSAVVLPAVLAAAEALNCNGKDFLSSFIVGYEVTCKLGRAVNPKAYEKGWWTTSALGTIGAAAAVGRLLGLNQEQTEWALGLAIGQASGVRANNGTLAKPFQAGRAAQSGVLSAELARKGLTASSIAFEKPAGFFDVCVDGDYYDVAELLGRPFDLVNPGVAFKQYPSCSASHAAVDALLGMVSEYDLSWTDVISVTCEVTPLVGISLVYDSPTMPDEARFSMPFCIAAAIKEKQLLPYCFAQDYLKDSVIIELMKKVTMKVVPNCSIGEKGFSLEGPEASRVIIETRGKKLLSKTVQHAKGGTQNPLSLDEIYDKFCRCTESIIPDQKIDQIKRAVFGIESFTHAGELVGLLEIKS